MRFNFRYFFGKRGRKGKTYYLTKKNHQKTVNQKCRKGKVITVTRSKRTLIQLKNQVVSKTKIDSLRKEKTLATQKTTIITTT